VEKKRIGNSGEVSYWIIGEGPVWGEKKGGGAGAKWGKPKAKKVGGFEKKG